MSMSVTSRILHSRAQSIAFGVLLILAIGVLDYYTGRECQMVALYLLPVGATAWGAGRRWGIASSLLAAGTWLVAELASGALYALNANPLWNALMYLLVFLSVALLLSELHEIMNSLERRVKIRSGQLKEEMTLRHDAELARLRAERLAIVGTMAAQVAHEVRNPMGAIALNLDLLSYELRDMAGDRSHPMAEAELLVSQISQEIGRVEKVMSGYLSFARLPKVVPDPQPLHAFLDEKLATVVPELNAAGVRLDKDYDPRIHTVNLDAVQMWQVILNLVRNAREAMPQGGRLTVRTHLQDTSLEFSVTDTGSGIRPEDLSRICTPFFTTKAQGTGLGLALSQQIISEHGGKLACRSTPGIGTTFAITLPRPKSSPHSYRLEDDTLGDFPFDTHEISPAIAC